MFRVRDHLHRLENVHSDNPLYFITCCTANRRRVLVTPIVAEDIIEAFRAARTIHAWAVGRYVIMPDHVHFFARPEYAAKTLSEFIRDWKKWTAHRVVQVLAVPPPIWQAEFFDHILRSADSYSEKWDYVRQNPVRAGLVARPEAWPFAGACETLSF